VGSGLIAARLSFVGLFCAGVLTVGAACGSSSSAHQGAGKAAPPASSFPKRPCRADPLAGVHSPDRLALKGRCRAIVGEVREVQSNPDGDKSFNLWPDTPYAGMLNDKNRGEGGLHIEIVPADQPGCVPGQAIKPISDLTDLGTCTGADVEAARVGQHVRVVGAYVLDVPNDWFEIHPAWKITAVSTER
jgi:hypothetical protein